MQSIFLLPLVFLYSLLLANIKIEIPPETKIVTPKTLLQKPQIPLMPQRTDDGQPWGVARQIDDVTWRIKVGQDAQMGSPLEILIALNDYRRRYGVSNLSWDLGLANYAQSRAVYFNKIKNLDGHKGFIDFLNNQNGFEKLGFNQLGENASYGYRLSGVHLIEWIYAGDEPHNKNQLNSVWNYVGIGIDGTATDLIFGTGKF